ncbi:hypothetical protein ACLOJK_006943 [Asimina triloba]
MAATISKGRWMVGIIYDDRLLLAIRSLAIEMMVVRMLMGCSVGFLKMTLPILKGTKLPIAAAGFRSPDLEGAVDDDCSNDGDDDGFLPSRMMGFCRRDLGKMEMGCPPFGHNNRCSSMRLPDLKGTPIGDEGGEARVKMLSSMPAAAIQFGLLSRQICDHIVVANLLNSSDHRSLASLVVGSPETADTSLSLLGRHGRYSRQSPAGEPSSTRRHRRFAWN